ncbi:hypothetical protein BDV59DRAFT_196830 [Aspergillus ambiguus]|uniref:uncharacterized protein n=1 Tax=Aspergillus ambiguus TaxID=176160 RepID=UPI003CCDBBD5
MLVDMEKAPPFENILAAFCCWILLAGYLVLPGTFASIQGSSSQNVNVSLLGVAGALCVVGLLGTTWSSYKRRMNYVWLVLTLFSPILINSITGFINTVINVYTSRDGTWSVTAVITAAVTGSFSVISGLLYLYYNHWLLARLEKAFDDEMNRP